MTWTIQKAFGAARKELGLTLAEFSERIKVSPGHLSLVETGKKQPSEMMVELTIRVYCLNRDWVETGKGEIFYRREQVPLSPEAKILLGSLALMFFMPAASVGLAIGVGVSEIVKKMCAAYKVQNATELARKFFKINRATITHWEKQDSIPAKYLQKAAKDTGVPVSHFTTNDQALARLTDHLLSSVEEIIKENNCAKHPDREEIRADLIRKVTEKSHADPAIRGFLQHP